MQRNASIDLLRGTIMLFMALDHASLMVGRMHFSEFWGVEFTTYPDIFWWLTRFVSHLCAPGFFLLMGMSIYLFSEKRMKAGWSASQIRNYFLKRGSLILVLMLFLELPAFAIQGISNQVPSQDIMPGQYNGGFMFPGTVLFGLGLCMLIGAFLWKWSKKTWLRITLLCFALSAVVIGQVNPDQAFHPLLHMTIIPGMSDGALSMYPIIPWLGIMTFGLYCAKLMKEQPATFFRTSLRMGLAFLALFFLIRSFGLGNFQKGDYHDWISYFTLIKYPPSFAFALFTCGIHLILLNIFTRSFGRPWLRPVLIFGQTAMFFYLAHLHLYAWLGALFFREGCSIGLMYLIWLAGLVVLFYLCRWFLSFKNKKKAGSFWRMI